MKLDEVPANAGFIFACNGVRPPSNAVRHPEDHLHEMNFMPALVGGPGNSTAPYEIHEIGPGMSEVAGSFGHEQILCDKCRLTERLTLREIYAVIEWARANASYQPTGKGPDGAVYRRFVAPLGEVDQILRHAGLRK